MTSQSIHIRENSSQRLALSILTGLAFLILFFSPLRTLLRDWWSHPEAQHGLLLGPLAIFLAWKSGLVDDARGQAVLGGLILLAAVLLRYVSELAAEMFTMRGSLILGVLGLVVFFWGVRQALRWWLSFVLVGLSVPLPQVLLSSLAFPLQIRASRIGAYLLEARDVPVLLEGNIINIPGQALFVTEACSGLRSLTALLALGVLLGALWLRKPLTRILLIIFVIPIAMVLNGIRVFLTGYLVFFIGPEMGEGFMHMSEGWGMFLVAFLLTGLVTWGLGTVETAMIRRRQDSG